MKKIWFILAFTSLRSFMASAQTVRDFFVKLPFETEIKKVRAEVIGNQVIMEGDIILGTLDEIERQHGVNLPDTGRIRRDPRNQRPRMQGMSVSASSSTSRWPDSVIPYIIESSDPNSVTAIVTAISYINENTNLCMVRRNGETDYVKFVDATGCSSRIGRKGIGEQEIRLSPSCGLGAVIHEICHTAGLYHEQSREDRDRYISVDTSNAIYVHRFNFNQNISASTDFGVYDYGSIMHYRSTEFSKNGSATITVNIPPALPGTVIGQRNGMSAGDINAINSIYSENEACKQRIRQTGWRWCVKCQGLFFSGDDRESGVCPAGDKHTSHATTADARSSRMYYLDRNNPMLGQQQGWRWCVKCQGLFFTGNDSDSGICPAGALHTPNPTSTDSRQSGKYSLDHNTGSGGQGRWRWCTRCQGLFYTGDGGDSGVCPSGGRKHTPNSPTPSASSGHYYVKKAGR